MKARILKSYKTSDDSAKEYYQKFDQGNFDRGGGQGGFWLGTVFFQKIQLNYDQYSKENQMKDTLLELVMFFSLQLINYQIINVLPELKIKKL